jgi:hypothetical protein
MKDVWSGILIMLVVVLAVGQTSYSEGSNRSTWSDDVQVAENLASVPLSFTANQGQWEDTVKFRAQAGGATMWFSLSGAYYQFTRTVSRDASESSSASVPPSTPDPVTLSGIEERDRRPGGFETMMIKANFVGANADPRMVGIEMIDYKCNYFIGNDRSKWATDVPNYTAVRYENIYDGIDLKYYGNGKQMEYDFIVEPGADFSKIEIEYEGAESVSINSHGELVVATKWGEVVEQRPVIYQIADGSRIPIEGRYRLKAGNSFGFELSAGYNQALPVIIDPVLTYSTYLGGSGGDYGAYIAVDDAGSAYVFGHTESADFPTLNPYQGANAGGTQDVFITKLNGAGDGLIFSTYLGGSGEDTPRDIAIDDSGYVYIAGHVDSISTDFPVHNAYIETHQGNHKGFVVKLNPSGNGLVYSTFLGASYYDYAYGIVADADGAAYVTGLTGSWDFPMLNAYTGTMPGGWDTFVTKFSSSGASLIYSTFLGGTNAESGESIAIDADGAAYITGVTYSTDFPVLNPYQGTFQDTADVFVTKLGSDGDSLIYSTYLGGGHYDRGYSIAVDTSGAAYIAGYTYSTDFPTVNAHQGTFGGGNYDGFAAKLNSSGDNLVYSTYLGGNSTEAVTGIAVDSDGSAYLSGWTASSDFPTVSPYDGTLDGSSDGHITKLSSSGSLLSSTFLGGTANDDAKEVALDTSGALYVIGASYSTDFPTTAGAYQTSLDGTRDAFVAKFSDFPVGVQEFDSDDLPAKCSMSHNYPNPFNPTTTIEFNLPRRSNVSINIYNLLGQKVQQLADQQYSAGNYRVTWDGTTSERTQASTGVYFYRIETDDFAESKKMVLLK